MLEWRYRAQGLTIGKEISPELGSRNRSTLNSFQRVEYAPSIRNFVDILGRILSAVYCGERMETRNGGAGGKDLMDVRSGALDCDGGPGWLCAPVRARGARSSTEC